MINGRPVSKQKWVDVFCLCERYPFFQIAGTVLNAQFETHPVRDRDVPVVYHKTSTFSDTMSYGFYPLDQIIVWYALIFLGRSLNVFIALQLLNLLVWGSAGFAHGFVDPVAMYVNHHMDHRVSGPDKTRLDMLIFGDYADIFDFLCIIYILFFFFSSQIDPPLHSLH